MLQALLGISNSRVPWAAMNGPPNAPAGLRVSATRHGVTGTKVSPAGVCGSKLMAQEPPPELSQFDCIRNCLPLRTILACAPFNEVKVVPNLKLHKSPFSPAVSR